MTRPLIAALAVLMLAACPALAQTIDVGPPDTSVCNGQPITLTAITTGTPGNPQFYNLNLNTDDNHGGVINIGFPFNFFGNTYTQCVVSTNGYITFDLSQANQYSPWGINAASPTPGVPDNSIMFPWQDINPGAGSAGTNAADCGDGTFVVDFVDIAMFSCTNLSFSMQVVLYENSNIIDTYITNKPLCTTWNGGAAIHGLENANGTQAVIVPGRNYPTQWTAVNDAVRFTPNGSGSYTIDQAIPFNPIPVGNEVYVWTNMNTGAVVGNGVSITVSPTEATWYRCTYQSACSAITVSDSILVTLGNVNITAQPSHVTCHGFSDGRVEVNPAGSLFPVTLRIEDSDGMVVQQAGGLNGNYIFTGLPAGTYTVVVTDAVGCETSLSVTVTQPTPLQISAGHRNILCTGDNNGRAWAFASGGTPPYARQWNDPFQLTTDTIKLLGPGPYTATFTDANGCVKDTTMIIVQPFPLTITLQAGADTCARSDGAVRAQMNGGTPPYRYIWNTISDSLFYHVDHPERFNRIWRLPVGTYTVTVKDSNNCTISATANVPLIPPPVAGFSTMSKPEEMVSPEVDFFNESTASSSYLWYFGDGDISTKKNPSHAYSDPGSYLVMLISYSEPQFGCSDTAFRYIDVDPLFTFYVPTGFTPDGDGLNDFFMPMGENFDYETYNLKIYDRWGTLVWQTDNPKMGWDGRMRGSDVPMKEGVYLYIFVMKKFNAFEPKTVRGSVMLYRNRP